MTVLAELHGTYHENREHTFGRFFDVLICSVLTPRVLFVIVPRSGEGRGLALLRSRSEGSLVPRGPGARFCFVIATYTRY